MIEVKNAVDEITVQDVLDVLDEIEDVEFDELLIESYDYDHDENDNCVLNFVNVVVQVYAANNYSETVKFKLNLDGAVCEESEIDDKLHELLSAKVDNEVLQ